MQEYVQHSIFAPSNNNLTSLYAKKGYPQARFYHDSYHCEKKIGKGSKEKRIKFAVTSVCANNMKTKGVVKYT